MEIQDKIVVITGAASGIGRAMAFRFAKAGAKKIICVDLNSQGVEATAKEVKGVAYTINVANDEAVKNLIDDIETNIGPIDLFCSNAGISVRGGAEVKNDDWYKIWDVNVMSHIFVARYLIPKMIARGGGYLLNTASAAGLLSQIGSAPYAVSKHAAVAFSEWLALTHGDDGIKVSVLCPQAVRTEMTKGLEDAVASIDGMMEPEPVAEACLQAIETETFLVLPHPEVLDYMRRKTDNYDRWIGGMRKLNRAYNPKD
ncbi:SDR family oxidoreductase [Aurantivibrio infirmus]